MRIVTVDNFICNRFSFDNNSKIITDTYYLQCKRVKDIKDNINITFKDYKNSKNNLFIDDDSNKRDDDKVISLQSHIDNDEKLFYNVVVGNFVGKFTYNGVKIDIKSRFSDIFLKRILNFANDVFLDDVSLFDAKYMDSKDTDYSKFITYYMFIQKLEKAFLLGLPKSYVNVNHHVMKVKGKIDINRFIKYDIPFKGKVSSTSREQKEIQEIIDVLYKAISIIEKESKKTKAISTKNILNIKTHLKQHKSNRYVSNETISKAIKSKALQNPIFAPYKKVLEYAKLIISANNLEEKKDANKETFGFLVNVAELFEIYLVKLLRLHMPDWEVIHEEQVDVYKDNFFRRNMYPDIVMKKDNKVMVFDAKYKRMKFRGRDKYGAGDLDRNDFFQINTYMTYYDKKGYDVIAGGLLYPMEADIEKTKQTNDKKAHSDNWFGNSETKFIVDGIDLSKNDFTMEDILKSEDAFINRIKKLVITQ